MTPSSAFDDDLAGFSGAVRARLDRLPRALDGRRRRLGGVAPDSPPGARSRVEDPFFRKDGVTFTRNVDLGASGLAAVWATENTRAARFGAKVREDVGPVVQERAYTSPTWHVP